MGAAIGIIGAASAVIGTGVSIIGRQQAAAAREQAAQLQLRETKAATEKRKLDRTRKMNEVMGTQIARQGSSGFSLTSPSFNAIQIDSLNEFARDANADAMNFSFASMAEARTASDASSSAFFGSLEDVFNLGSNLAQDHISNSARSQANLERGTSQSKKRRDNRFWG